MMLYEITGCARWAEFELSNGVDRFLSHLLNRGTDSRPLVCGGRQMNSPAQNAPDPAAPSANVSMGAVPPVSGSEADSESVAIHVQTPQYQELPTATADKGMTLDRFFDVSVTVSAELGRVSMPLGEMLRLGTGAVIKLDRPVSAPVELLAQGVRVALGEVVVVDDCFAVRIKEIERTRRTDAARE